MAQINILVAEDDPHIRTGLLDTLESEGYRVTVAENGRQAEALFEKGSFGLVILDIMMPEKNGYDVCRDIRKTDEQVPVIMLTAKGEEIDKVVGLQLGADDYITKPFGVHELLARIAAVLRRSGLAQKKKSGSTDEPFVFGPFEVDPRTFKLKGKDGVKDLSGRELKLIRHFCACPGEVLTRNRLLNAVWGIDYLGTTRTLDQHIAQLRKKIETNPASPEIITTVHGIGYRYNI